MGTWGMFGRCLGAVPCIFSGCSTAISNQTGPNRSFCMFPNTCKANYTDTRQSSQRWLKILRNAALDPIQGIWPGLLEIFFLDSLSWCPARAKILLNVFERLPGLPFCKPTFSRKCVTNPTFSWHLLQGAPIPYYSIAAIGMACSVR